MTLQIAQTCLGYHHEQLWYLGLGLNWSFSHGLSMYHDFKVTCLTKVELGARDLAWRSLKQCCSV